MKKGTPQSEENVAKRTRARNAVIAERNAVFNANHAAALEAGETKYVGRLCRYNHDDGNGASVRYVSAKSCIACAQAAYDSPEGKAKRRVATHEWFHANKDNPEFQQKYKELAKARYESLKEDPKDKQKRNEISRAWYEAHKDDPELKAKRAAAAKRWYETHKDDPEYMARRKGKVREWNEGKGREWREANPPTQEEIDQRNARAREIYAQNCEERRAAQRERYAMIKAAKLAAQQVDV